HPCPPTPRRPPPTSPCSIPRPAVPLRRGRRGLCPTGGPWPSAIRETTTSWEERRDRSSGDRGGAEAVELHVQVNIGETIRKAKACLTSMTACRVSGRR